MSLNQYRKAMKICCGLQNDLRVRINFTNALLRFDQSYFKYKVSRALTLGAYVITNMCYLRVRTN